MLLKEKEEIKAWLNKNQIKGYILIKNEEYGYVVNVNGNVVLYNKNLKNIEVKFNEINGWFNCTVNKLNSLEGCPEIVHGNFNCNDNKLKTLEFCPKIVNGDFDCSNNKLINLKGSPKTIYGSFDCSKNKIISLNDCDSDIEGDFCATENNLTIKGLKKFPLIENKIELLNNKKLGNLQSINNITELKKKVDIILKIQEEKENLLNVINKKNLKIKKINKI